MRLHNDETVSGGLQQPTLRPHLVRNEGFGRCALSLILVVAPSYGIAQASDSLTACTRITADSARLACFDRAMADMRSAGSQSPAPAGAPTVEQEFGLSTSQVHGLEAKPGDAPVPTRLHAHVVSVSNSGAARQVFVLDNAQTWQQIELDPDFSVHIGQEVTISKGALGSFWLAIDSHRATRVKRVLKSTPG